MLPQSYYNHNLYSAVLSTVQNVIQISISIKIKRLMLLHLYCNHPDFNFKVRFEAPTRPPAVPMLPLTQPTHQ